MLHVRFDIAGDAQVDRAIFQVVQKGTDFRVPLRAIMSDMLLWEEEQFESEGGTGSGGWVELKPEYKARKIAQGLDPRILHATGALARALTAPGRPQGSLRRITKKSLNFGTTIEYAGVHQNPKETNPLPRRRPVEFTASQREDIVHILQNWIKSGVVNY